MDTRRLASTLSLKTVDGGQRIIAGWAAVAGNLDRVGDVIDPGAFTKTLAAKRPSDVAVFIGHDMADLPVGVPVKIEATDQGLYTETKVFEGPAGDNLLAVAKGLAEHGQTLGMSIGYRATASKPDRVNGKLVRRLTEIDLIEYSFAARQTIANPAALVVGVKAGGQMYRVQKTGDRYHVMRGDKSLADFGSEAEAQAKVDALNADADKTLSVNDLPDSAFLFVEPGGVLDESGRTVPRAKRHFPYRDHDGLLDIDRLKVAAAAIPEAKTLGLDDAELARLGARARLLLDLAEDGKTVDEDAWDLKSTVALDVRSVGYDLMRLADEVASEMHAMVQLGIDTRNGARVRFPMREKIRAAIAVLQAIVARAEEDDRDDDPKAVVDWYRQWFEVAALGGDFASDLVEV